MENFSIVAVKNFRCAVCEMFAVATAVLILNKYIEKINEFARFLSICHHRDDSLASTIRFDSIRPSANSLKPVKSQIDFINYHFKQVFTLRNTNDSNNYIHKLMNSNSKYR